MQIQRKDSGIDPATVPLPDEVPAPGQTRSLNSLGRRVGFLSATLLRTAVSGMVQSGDDMEMIADSVWDMDQDYYQEAIRAGVADAIASYHEQLTPEALRRLVERGVNNSKATTRKRFYGLSTQFYGTDYLQKALDDTARSVRTWAAKQLGKR